MLKSPVITTSPFDLCNFANVTVNSSVNCL